MLVRTSSDSHVPVLDRFSFGEWIDHGHDLGWPTLEDLEYHLTTLFPPVRPRGWLELRMLDAVPAPWWRVAVAVSAVLVQQPDLVDEIRPVLAPTLGRWADAARDGLSDPDLAAAARVCFEVALTALPDAGADPSTIARDRSVRRALRGPRSLPRRRPARRLARRPLAAPRARQHRPGRPRSHPDRGHVELNERVADQLGHARDRTLALLEPFDASDLSRQVSPLMSPLVWDLAHIAHFEELWLLRTIAAAPPTDPRYDDLYDAFKHPRRERSELDILEPADARAFAADVRRRVLDHLATVSFDGNTIPCSATRSSTAW